MSAEGFSGVFSNLLTCGVGDSNVTFIFPTSGVLLTGVESGVDTVGVLLAGVFSRVDTVGVFLSIPDSTFTLAMSGVFFNGVGIAFETVSDVFSIVLLLD